jgi:hypothetical protein
MCYHHDISEEWTHRNTFSVYLVERDMALDPCIASKLYYIATKENLLKAFFPFF